jgi:hypothetical protein
MIIRLLFSSSSSSFLLLFFCFISFSLAWHSSLLSSLDTAQRNRHLLNRLPDRSHPPDDGSHFTDSRGLAWTRMARWQSLFHHPQGLSGNLIDWAMGRPERYWKVRSN